MFISDVPISSSKFDILGREKFSHALGKTIVDLEEDESFVIGLYGKWGQGKTSIVNMLKEFLSEEANIGKDKLPIIIEFNPWNFSEQSQLISAFFNEIANKLKFVDSSKQAQEIAKKLKLYGSFLSSAEVISETVRYVFPAMLFIGAILLFGASNFTQLNPIINTFVVILLIVGTISALSKKILYSLSDFFIEKANYNKKTLEELKTELSKLIKKRNKKIIIIVDDIDRLTQSEIRQMLQLVKINADFPRTVYLLPFEREIIEKNLEEQKGVSGKEYLKKIIQVDFDIPEIQKNKLYKYLFSELDLIIKNIPESKWNETYWGNLFHSGFKDFFSSLRDVKRYINSLRFNFLLIQKEGVLELNPIDFIGLESIRVFVPEFYQSLKDNKSLFTMTDSSYGSGGSSKEYESRRKEIDKLLGPFSESVRGILFQLFPQVKGLFDNMHYGSDFQSRWERERRICATEIFDRYFLLDVPEGELAQFEIEKIIHESNDRVSLKQLLEGYIADNRIKTVLGTLENYTDNFDLKNAEQIVTALFDISDNLPEDRVTFVDVGIDMHLMRIIYHYLKRFKNAKKSSEVLEKAIKETSGLSGVIDKLSVEIGGVEKESHYERLIERNDVEKFKNLCVEKIKAYKASPVLLRSNHLAHILFRWRDWGDKEEVKEFVKGLIEPDEGLVFLIQAFLSKSYRHSMGDYVGRTISKINYKSLAEFVELDQIKQRLEKIDTSKLSPEGKKAVELFLKDYDRKDKNNDFDDDE